ncbi:MAG: short-chain dehydrogenase [Acidobacteria bacterium]|nr:MAG: short-chain dehydrogenase [Acidobacteriota bacterium]
MLMDLGIKGKIAIVSGASAGIGAAVVARLASEGVRVVACARNEARLQKAVQDSKAARSGEILGFAADCAKQKDVDALVEFAVSSFGGVDILVNLLAGPKTAEFFELSDEDWHEALNLKLMGQIRCARTVFPLMKAKNWGRIINVIGTHGHQPHAYLMSAGVVNAGLLNFTKALAELGAPHGILVNAVNPGPIETERMAYVLSAKSAQHNISIEEARRQWEEGTLLKRYGLPNEIAAVVAFLASDLASYVTGTSIDVDGGQTQGV